MNERLTTFKNLRSFKARSPKSSHRYSVTVGIGGNVGDVLRRFDRLCTYLRRDKRVELLQKSLILKNPPFGFTRQDDFFNSIIVLKTSMQPMIFLDYLMRVEKKFARKRSFANAPRTLDLDIIFFDKRVVATQKLQIPHAEWFKRESVLIPLADIKR
ncbi:MAG: 2-amino-4-hydroxy-6-hydroxymethyldihydropteridine diphosphokinase [Sulfurimonas sp.]|uniref:2-amino-4-hydroxy-6- hydroxymethyldihydropteridine diphosphokinase n=1 Tax=Sulfurimonas sp. TaxID=2022749 RepID=UPI002603159F|nr:2-amino-4-hydroxy-6-hydroxymethyldihydropteridine diphosphokinase [Sulfurimonas sp.]MDD2651560.1 2-amino-4-hydroxy-6-hydroxymethyldihydropteridine diphosphokinase [Sulfurimonas sp.]MDD3451371.1 2-amino-4-hydroxy-6-hydroxymethyldihydropteridine diphosphokinase [Sulfurimonas sp.]